MAIQIRRGTNTEWESNNSNIVAGEPAIATDAERFFVGTSSGDYAEFANLDIIAPAYDNSASYEVGDVINRQGKLYSCNTPCSGAFNISYWDEKSLAEILKDLENEIDYAQYEIGYANGKLITIDNGASEIPVKDLTLDIEAVQDLHGYDAPWVGGAGKNKILLRTTNSTQTLNGVTASYNASTEKITFSGTNTNTSAYILWMSSADSGVGIFSETPVNGVTYYVSGTLPTGVYANIVYKDTSNTTQNTASLMGNGSFKTKAFTFTNYMSFVRFQIGVAGYATSVSGTTGLMFSTTEPTTYEPYSNICPISGWDEVNVCVAGKNMFDISTFSANDCMYQYASSFTYGIGSATLTKNEDSFTLVRINTSYAYFICVGKCFANIPVTISFNVTNGYVYDIEARTEPPTQAPNNDKRFYRDTSVGGLSSVVRTFTPAQDGYVYLEIYSTSGNLTNTVANLQYEFGSTKTDYERGSKQTYTIDLDGTRYGGSLDVTNGVLTVTHTMIDLGSLTYDRSVSSGIYRFQAVLPSAQQFKPIADNYTYANMICENYKTDSWNHVASSADNGSIGLLSTGTIIAIQDNSFTDANAFKTAMSGVKLVGELATPQVVQLTPTQVRTLLGANNLWNQMNSNNELAYRISNALN